MSKTAMTLWPAVALGALLASCGVQLGEGMIGDGSGVVRRGGAEAQPERCLDGVDNDRDGQVDEDCPGKVAGAEQPQERCDDGVDNDLDGQVDEDCPSAGAGGGGGVERPGEADPGDDGGGEAAADPPNEEQPGEAADGGGDDGGTPGPEDPGGDEGDEGGDDGGEPAPEEPEACPAHLQRCDEGCVDARSDPENCGGCGQRCDEDERCVAGDCERQGCEGGERECGEGCVDIMSDDENCGGCGRRCDGNERCEAGDCERRGCEAGEEDCGDGCVNVDDDPRNCGGCGNECVGDEECQAGVCEPGRLGEDDRYEENDSPEEARPMGLPVNENQLRLVRGDDDWYSVQGCDQGDLYVDITYPEGDIHGVIQTAEDVLRPVQELESGERFLVQMSGDGDHLIGLVYVDGPDEWIEYTMQLERECPAVDMDGDGSPADVDCDDANPAVFPDNPEICDGEDNDCNGVADDGGDEVCDDRDNDCDGEVDEGLNCDGGDGSTCEEAMVASLGEQLEGRLEAGASGHLSRGCAAESNEMILRFSAGGAGSYVFDLSGSDFDTTLYLREDCDDINSELSCDADGGEGNTSRIELELNAGQEVFVFIDGNKAGDTGNWVLNITE